MQKFTGTYVGTGTKMHAAKSGRRAHCGKRFPATVLPNAQHTLEEITCVSCQQALQARNARLDNDNAPE